MTKSLAVVSATILAIIVGFGVLIGALAFDSDGQKPSIRRSAEGTLVLNVISQTSTTITLGWTPQAGYGYLFSRDGTVVSRTSDPTKSSVKFSKGGTYEVAVLVKGAWGTYPPVAPPPTGDTQSPSAPSSLSTSVTETTVTLSWGDASDNVGVVNYRIYRGTTLLGQGPGSSGGFSNSWLDSDRVCGTAYTYGVEAQDSAGNVGPKATATATTVACSTPPPPPPPPPGGTTITSSQCASLASVAGAVLDGYTVTGGCNVSGANVTIRNSILSGTIGLANGTKVENSTAMGWDSFGDDNWVLTGNTFDGKGTDNQNLIWDQPAGDTSNNWRISNNTFKNFYGVTNDIHSEAIYVGYSNGGIIENNIFINNGNTSHIFFTNFGSQFNSTSYPRNICVRGNTFQDTHGAYYDINFHQNVSSVGPSTTNIRINPNNVMPHGTTNPEFNTVC